ncbi:hypothetical protein ABID22_003392 [Pontibacter aydingkolensis]|uniref:Uncharacterized protein n=1 Tax=Pontibacter aydingkolensis TaxID=1911536 RepID=A0ABS7CXU0_9BACT|nr:hypothetical protein [Pontibacter aydingkolensis]MBW7468613.1 hypothetical protein [Pontibacter aydingkolensis]
MKSTGIQIYKKLNLLLAVLLCSMLAFTIPITVKAAPTSDTAYQDNVDYSAENQLVLFAGEVCSGEPEAVLQLDKSLLAPILQVLLQQLYPNLQNASPAPHSYPASKGDCGLHTILTKGP